MTEAWVDIKDFEGHYQVSDLGRVISMKNSKRKILKPGNSKGYMHVVLCRNGEKKRSLVHRLVYEAFVSRTLPLQINHIDGNPSNNRVSNLEASNARHNTLHGQRLKSRVRGGYKFFIGKHGPYFKAMIRLNGKRINLGQFPDMEAARKAYEIAYIEHHGVRPW